MSFSEMASDLVQLLEQNASEAPIVIGHSLGGKVAMVLALNSPQWVERLIVVDIAPTTYPPKTHPHLIKAMMDLDLEQLEGRRAQADQALKPSISDPALRQFLLQNLVLKQGRFDWRINLQPSTGRLGSYTGFPSFQT
jgi:pimeloyl-ACP methyl ester carboxylesterase